MGALRINMRMAGWRQFALLAVLLYATMLRALVPAGFMPSANADGIGLSVCSSDGPVIPGEDSQTRETSRLWTKAHGPCAFSGTATDAPPPAAPIVSVALAVSEGRFEVDDTYRTAPPIFIGPQSPRAPPVSQS
jgi:hypothetical protein